MSNQPTRIEQLWSEISGKTATRLACMEARQQWRMIAISIDELLNGVQRDTLASEDVEIMRELRFLANKKAAMWNRRIADIDVELAELQMRLSTIDKDIPWD